MSGCQRPLPPNLRDLCAEQPVDSPGAAPVGLNGDRPAPSASRRLPGAGVSPSRAHTWPWGVKGGPGVAPATQQSPSPPTPHALGGRGRARGEYRKGPGRTVGKGVRRSVSLMSVDSSELCPRGSQLTRSPAGAQGTELLLRRVARLLCHNLWLY